MLMGIDSDHEKMERWVDKFGCEVGFFPCYLGFPLGGHPRATTFWDIVYEQNPKEACYVEERLFL